MITKVSDYIEKNNMVHKGDTLIVGVSGGADSVCLLSVLCKLREKWNLKLICAHINHMFRETAVRDEEYVQSLCENWNIPCYIQRVDVEQYAKANKISFEEAGRIVRYTFFRELKAEYGADKIAVAHNKGDCAETVLFHLFRGSHLKGLGGMEPVHDDIIRPLLIAERCEIEAYLTAENIVWQKDETNDSVDYARNYIRHIIFPAAERMYPGVQGRIAETAFGLQQAEDYLEIQTKEAMERCCCCRDGGTFIEHVKLQKEHPAIVSRLLYSVLEKESQTARDLGKVHVRELEELLSLQSGRRISLPGNICAYRTTEGILVRKEVDCPCETAIALLSNKDLAVGKEIVFRLEGLGCVRAKVLSDWDLKNIPQKTYTKWFDYDKITKCAVFRKRMEGDYLVINEAGNCKKLKEYFIQEKIPAYKRNEMWIMADDNHVMWIPGYRISSYYKISGQTKKVLELTIGGKEDE